MSADFDRDIAKLAGHYSKLVEQHGTAPEGAQYVDRTTQEQRYRVLCEIGVTADSKVLDFGCGTGHLLGFLQRELGFTGEYVGYDVSAAAVTLAKETRPEGRFEVRNVLADPPEEQFDFILVGGTFNNQMSDNRGFFEAVSKALMPSVRRGYAFNLISRFVDYFDEGLWYADPLEVFRFCKEELSPAVTLRHDYAVREGAMPFEFTTYVYASEHAPRPLKDG